MNFENCKACNLHGLLLYLLDKMTLKRTDKYNTSSNLSIYYPRKNTKKVTSATTWNDKFELSDGSYFLSGIQEYFNYVFKNTEKRLVILQLEYMYMSREKDYI